MTHTTPVALSPLFEHRTWVNWEFADTRKRPLQPNGRWAKTDDDQTWSTYPQCAARVVTLADAERKVTPGYDPKSLVRGVGFVHSRKTNVLTIDIDAKKVGGPKDPRFGWMLDIYNSTHTYAETSPSGRGCHIMGTYHGDLGDEIEDRIGNGVDLRGCVDLFCNHGFVTVTGDVCRDLPLLDITEVVHKLLVSEGIDRRTEGLPQGVCLDPNMTYEEAYNLATANVGMIFHKFLSTPVEPGCRAYNSAVYYLIKELRKVGCPASTAYRMIRSSPVTTQSQVPEGRESRAEKLARIFDKTWSKK
ncbi:hypothetical protein ACQZ5N_01000 [Agrobacterium sp. 22-221-1]